MTTNDGHSARGMEGQEELAHYISHYILEEFERMDDSISEGETWGLSCEMLRGWVEQALEAYEGGAR